MMVMVVNGRQRGLTVPTGSLPTARLTPFFVQLSGAACWFACLVRCAWHGVMFGLKCVLHARGFAASNQG